jgi:hypothetical protein
MNATAKRWGLPDWENKDSYGDTKSWSMDRWRWEFTRRRTDYREWFERLAPEYYQDLIKRRGPTNSFGRRWLQPHEPGFRALGDMQSFWTFGLDELPNPAISDQPEHVICFGHPKLSFSRESISVGRDEIGVVLSLRETWSDQGDTIELYFKDAQKQFLGPVKAHKLRPEKWFRYLRILDGRECGASWSKLAPISSDRIGSQLPKNALQVWQAAHKLSTAWPS